MIRRRQTMDYTVSIEERVARLVEDQAIKQVALAKRLGIGERTLRRRLLGQTRWTTSEVVTLAGLLGVSPSYLLTGTWETR